MNKRYDKVTDDVLKCPYADCLNRPGLPELTKSFCDSDEYVYCNLQNVSFIRSSTLRKRRMQM